MISVYLLLDFVSRLAGNITLVPSLGLELLPLAVFMV